MKVLVLGGGLMGSVIAKDLKKKGYNTTVADIGRIDVGDVNTIYVDLSHSNTRRVVISNYDLIVSAMPSQIGYGAVSDAINLGKSCVDLSYCPENIMCLDSVAKYHGALVVPDAGIAPGFSNLLIGKAMNDGCKDITLYVGGFAKDWNAPLGYAATWSVEDLLDEFVRPARIIKDGEEVTVDALSGVKQVAWGGYNLEAFYTDGLRTILDYKKDWVQQNRVSIEEKTMRRTGYMDETKKLLEDGKFVEYVKEHCLGLPDVLVMHIQTEKYSNTFTVVGDDEMSAMGRTTALSCSTFAQLILEGKIVGTGIIPPEVLSENEAVYNAYIEKMKNNGVK